MNKLLCILLLLTFVSCGPSREERLKASKFQPGQTIVLKGMSDTLIIVNLTTDVCHCNPIIYEAKRFSNNHISDTLVNVEEIIIDHAIDENQNN